MIDCKRSKNIFYKQTHFMPRQTIERTTKRMYAIENINKAL